MRLAKIFGCCRPLDAEVNTDIERAQLEHERLQRLSTPNLYAKMLTHEAYEEIHENLTSPFKNTIFINLQDEDHVFLERARYAVDLHDTFAIIRDYLTSWDLPCIVMCRRTRDTITGLQLLAIGSSAAVNWIGHIVNNGPVMAEFFKYAGLLFTKDCRTAVITSRETASTLAPTNSPTPTRRPRTQSWVRSPPLAPPRVQHHNRQQAYDSDEDSVCGIGAYLTTAPEVHPPPLFSEDL